jgi:hypothetical protein
MHCLIKFTGVSEKQCCLNLQGTSKPRKALSSSELSENITEIPNVISQKAVTRQSHSCKNLKSNGNISREDAFEILWSACRLFCSISLGTIVRYEANLKLRTKMSSHGDSSSLSKIWNALWGLGVATPPQSAIDSFLQRLTSVRAQRNLAVLNHMQQSSS